MHTFNPAHNIMAFATLKIGIFFVRMYVWEISISLCSKILNRISAISRFRRPFGKPLLRSVDDICWPQNHGEAALDSDTGAATDSGEYVRTGERNSNQAKDQGYNLWAEPARPNLGD